MVDPAADDADDPAEPEEAGWKLGLVAAAASNEDMAAVWKAVSSSKAQI